MSNKSSFYVTLPSNGSKRFFKDNTTSCFRNHLAQALELEGQWEVALVEMQYPITWKLLTKENKIGLSFFHSSIVGQYKPKKCKAKFTLSSQFLFNFPKATEFIKRDNFTKADLKMGMDRPMQNFIDRLSDAESEISYVCVELSEGFLFNIFFRIETQYLSVDYVEAYLPKQYYNSPAHVARVLVKEIRDKVASMTDILEPRPGPARTEEVIPLGTLIDKETAVIRFYTNLDTAFCGLVMYKTSEELYHVLGFQPPTEPLTFQEMPFHSQSTRPQMKFKTPALYVYSDIIGDELVGDAKVPLLRAVPIDGEMGDFVHKEFIRPYYKQLTKGYINSILMEVKDDTGEDIEFTLGKVICTLHFRRCGLAV